jgi:integrase
MQQEQEHIMAGRNPTLNWTKSRRQYTVTIAGRFHLLGTDRIEAERQYQFLLNKHDLAEPADLNPTFASIADRWLQHVEANHSPERFRNCLDRLESFTVFIGEATKVRDLHARHLEEWVASKPGVSKPGTERLYKAMVLAALNWAASKRVRLIPSNPLKGLVELPEGESRGGEAVWSKKLIDMVVRHSNPAFADVVRILAWTGARPSTICRVEAKHYLPDLRLWDVEAIYRHRKSHVKYVKRIWLPRQAVALTEKLNKLHPEGPIFRNSEGEPWRPAALGLYMYQLQNKFSRTKNLDWPDNSVCLYGLRHTFATNFIKQHPDKIEYLRELLGHRDLTMIRRHYGHLYDEHAAMHGVLQTLNLPA